MRNIVCSIDSRDGQVIKLAAFNEPQLAHDWAHEAMKRYGSGFLIVVTGDEGISWCHIGRHD